MAKNETSEIIKSTNPKSQQIKPLKLQTGVRTPNIAFETLINLYYGSFVVSGLTDKIATAINSGFTTESEELMKVIKSVDHEFLNRNKINCGNAFFEVIRNGAGKVIELIPVLSNTILIMEDGDGYKQQIGSDVVFFNEFTPLDKRNERKIIWEQSKAKEKELVNTGKGCGFNPNLNEVYHFKNISLNNKYYGNSFFESVIDQILLLEQIDKYYLKGFDNGLIKSKILYPTGDKAKFSVDDKKVLKEFIKSKMKGIDKAFSTAILDKEIGQLDLEHDIDATAFIEYRTQLLQAVSIALNVPYDMLLNNNSNRASSQVSLETFNQFTIFPFQQQNLKDFKIIFSEGYSVEDLDYDFIDTKDEKEQMEVLTGYKKSGIMTANEVRAKLGLGVKDGGDVLQTDAKGQQIADAILKTESKNFYELLTDVENDLQNNL